MGILFTKLWRLFNHQEHKVIIVGLDNAGKTTILYQFSMNEVVHTSPTIGSNVEEIVVNNTHFLMWDIGGQESLRSSWNTYYTNTEFVIVVVDSTDRERISVTKEELYRMLAHEDLRKAGLLIFANKQDVKGCMSVAEISQSLQLTSVKDHQWHIQACCALTGEGLCQGLEWMMSRLRVRWWPLTLIRKRALSLCSLCLQKWAWNEDGGEVVGWMAVSSFLWSWRGQTAARTFYSSVIIYFLKDVWTHNKKKCDLFRRTLDNKRDSNYLNWIFCTVFLSAKDRGQQSVWLGNIHGLILQLCVSLAHRGLAVLPDWLWQFLLPPCVYSPVFSFNVVPAAECSSSNGWRGLKHAERRVKSQYALFLSVSMNNQWNKVFLSVSGELQLVMNEYFFQVTLIFCMIYFSLGRIMSCSKCRVCNFSYSFFSPLGGRMCHMSS